MKVCPSWMAFQFAAFLLVAALGTVANRFTPVMSHFTICRSVLHTAVCGAVCVCTAHSSSTFQCLPVCLLEWMKNPGTGKGQNPGPFFFPIGLPFYCCCSDSGIFISHVRKTYSYFGSQNLTQITVTDLESTETPEARCMKKR